MYWDAIQIRDLEIFTAKHSGVSCRKCYPFCFSEIWQKDGKLHSAVNQLLCLSVHEKWLSMMQLGLWEAFLKAAFMPSWIIPSTSQEQCGFSERMTTFLFLILSMEGMWRHGENKGGTELKMRTLGYAASLLLHTNKQSVWLGGWEGWEGTERQESEAGRK